MKKQVLTLSGMLFFMLSAMMVNGQGNPFNSKQKQHSRSIAMPSPVKMIPGISSTAGRNLQGFSFSPVSHPLVFSPAGKPVEGERHYNAGGTLIFFSGKVPDAVKFDQSVATIPADACYQYLQSISNDLKIKDVRIEFQLIDQRADELGMLHVKLQQVFKGIPVYGSVVYLHSSGDEINQFNGSALPTCQISNVIPSVDLVGANEISTADVSSRTLYMEMTESQKSLLSYQGPSGELCIYPVNRDPNRQYLAWHITIRPNFKERWEYFVDAQTGSILHFFNNTHSDGDVTSTGPDLNGVNRTIHCYQQGGSYLMVDVSRPMYNPQNQEGTLRVYDANYTSPSVSGFNPALSSSTNNTWGPKVISAQYNSTLTYEYYRVNQGKNSWNNQGGSVLSVINATEDDGSGLDNAYWNGVCLVYGNGATMFNPLAGALDVVAHELGHAFDEGSANLEYQNQSGALNESFADISAAVVERQNWKIGEDIVKPGAFPTGCLRDMSNPHNGGTSLSDPGYQPANVSEMYNGTQDNGGVHINSGIVNFAFYKYVSAVGMDKGEKTFLRALFNYLTRSSQFIDCRLAVVQSAKDLYGDGSTEVNAAKTAFDEVGITDGSGGNYQNSLPVNPGQDYILSYDMVASDPVTLYVSSTTGTDYVGISQTSAISKPSIVDNGSVAVFIGVDKKMHAITLTGQTQENIIQDEPIWSNVAISKDGSKIAAVTEYQDSAIYIYSYTKAEWVKAHLYNPTTQQGVTTNNVLYADALEWDYSGEFIMYDAYNEMNSSSTGQNIDYWDISFMRVWNNSTHNWGDGAVFKMVSGIPEGISIGNPSLSKNSPAVCAFDYLDENANSVSVLAGNLETGDFMEVFNNGTTLSYPNYSKLDDKIIFSAIYNSSPVVAGISMMPDKIHPASSVANVVIPDAKWGVWYAQGNRPLAVAEIENQGFIRVSPNPASDILRITLGTKASTSITTELYNSQGLKVSTSRFSPDDELTLSVSGLSPGLYLLKVTGKGLIATSKVVVR